MNLFKRYFPLLLVILFSFWAIKPLLNPGFFPMHDDTQVARVFEMKKALSDGMFPVRWVPDLGYGFGYPIFNFYAPFAYYIGAFFMFLGFDGLIATKIMIGLGTVLAGVFMYLFAREFWDETGGVIAGLLYIYAPYHALNIYVRGAIAELWAYAFIPLAFLASYKIFLSLESYVALKSSSKKHLETKKLIWFWVCISAVAHAAIIISHNLTAMMTTPFLFVFAVFLYIKLRSADKLHKPYFIFLGLLIGVLLSAFYWLPVLFEIRFTNVLSVIGGGSDYKDHFVCLPQFWNSPWGFGGSVPGCIDGLSFKIGKLHILLALISLMALPMFRKEKTKFQLSILFAIFLLISTFFTIKESKFIWDIIPHMVFFQFPWRFLTLVSFLLSFIGGAIIYFLPKEKKVLRMGAAGLIIAGVIFHNSKLFSPQRVVATNAEDITSKYALTWTASKISDEYMPGGFALPLYSGAVPANKIVKNKDVIVTSIAEKTQIASFVVNAKKSTDLFINLAYFPGWHVYVDNNQITFKYSGDGLIVPIPKGQHRVDIKFTQTPIEKLGNAISLTGVIILLAGIISHRKKIYG